MQTHPSLHHPKTETPVPATSKPSHLGFYAALTQITRQQMQSRANARKSLSA
ncbi:MAG: hypothetical protein RL217_1983 [Pseudomonadota bacterium]|jgi:hypothetical protein